MDVDRDISLSSDTWSFADALEHFDEHIIKSVPHCQEQRTYIAALSRFFLTPGAQVYEIGVSTAALAQAVLAQVPGRNIRYTGLDIEASMIEAAQKRLQHDARFEALQANAVDYPFQAATLVISYYTLQFIPLAERKRVLKRIYDILEPQGAFILYEKTLGQSALIQDMLNQLYWDFKAQQGLSAEAILNKAMALRGVSTPISLQANLQALEEAGFSEIEIIYRAHSFVGFLALKHPGGSPC